jgi:plastocyanin
VSRLSAVLVVLVALVAAAGCGGGGGGGGSATVLKTGDVVSMKSLRFHPDHVQVRVGQPVTWRNDEGVPHNVVAQSGADFESKTFGKDGTFSFTPGQAATIKYECTLHPGMTGTIDVVAK